MRPTPVFLASSIGVTRGPEEMGLQWAAAPTDDTPVPSPIGVPGGFARAAALHTVFQMRGARSAFPVMDHPALKASFRLQLHQPQFSSR